MTPLSTDPSSSRIQRLRSGTAARLAGLPVTTLRVWERRYGVVAAEKTEGGQRAYSTHDVSRLRLLRRLTQAGYGIGTIAKLELEALQLLADDNASSSRKLLQVATRQGAARGGMDIVVVGRSAARSIESLPGCTVRAVYDHLEEAEAAAAEAGAGAGVGALLVRLASLQAGVAERVIRLGTSLRAGAVFFVYAFGTEAHAEVLSRAGVSVRREPVAGRELARWVRGVFEPPGDGNSSAAPAVERGSHAGAQIAPRHFSDEALAQLMDMPSAVACECLRHMAEIVAQLAGFERYSDECLSTGPADMALHRHLRDTSGAARTMFEEALRRVVAEERLELRTGPPS